MLVTITRVINWSILFAFIACFSYQIVYLIVGGALPRNQTELRGTASALHKGRAALPALLAP